MEWKCSSGLGRVKHIAAEKYVTKELLQEWGVQELSCSYKKRRYNSKRGGGCPFPAQWGPLEEGKNLQINAATRDQTGDL